MNHYAIAGFLTFITSSALALIVYFKNPKRAVNQLYALFSISVATYGFGFYRQAIALTPTQALIAIKIILAGAIFIPIFFLHSIYTILEKRISGKVFLPIYITSIVFEIINWSTNWLAKDPIPKLGFNYLFQVGILYPAVALGFGICAWFALWQLFRSYRSARGLKSNQLKYIFWSTLIGFSGGSAGFALGYNINLYPLNPFGAYCVPLYSIIFAYAIVAYRVMDIEVVITKGLAYGTLTAIIAGAYIGLMAGVDRIFAGVSGYNPALAHSLLFIVVLFALIYILPQMKIRTIEITRRTLFRGKYDYQRELSEATRVIPTILNLEQLGDYILAKIRDTMMIDKLTLLVYNESEHAYLALTSLGLGEDVVSQVKIGENSALAGLLRNSAAPLVKEELEKMGTIPEEAMQLAGRHLDSLSAELCVPLMLRDDLTGILALSNKRTGGMFTEEDLSLLSALANQVALAIEYSKALDKIVSEKRYVGLGKAAMRMAHDIKNPLVPLKTFLQILPDKYPKEFSKMSKIDAEFTGRFYESALEGVDRINLLIERALHYARHPQPAFSQVELVSLLDDVLTQEDVSLKKAKIQLEKQYDASDDSIKADGEQLIELFSNIISNSIDAMEEVPVKKLIVKTQVLTERVAVEISDTGCGIAKHKISTMFDPFITYKHKGSGLGLAIVKKIVDDHKGIIEVKSEPKKGTTLRIILPKKQR